MTAMEELVDWLDKYADNRLYGGRELTTHEIKNKVKTLLKKEREQMGYTKQDVFKAGEMGEINRHDIEHIISYLDKAKEK